VEDKILSTELKYGAYGGEILLALTTVILPGEEDTALRSRYMSRQDLAAPRLP
jgi:hypothetical protein